MSLLTLAARLLRRGSRRWPVCRSVIANAERFEARAATFENMRAALERECDRTAESYINDPSPAALDAALTARNKLSAYKELANNMSGLLNAKSSTAGVDSLDEVREEIRGHLNALETEWALHFDERVPEAATVRMIELLPVIRDLRRLRERSDAQTQIYSPAHLAREFLRIVS